MGSATIYNFSTMLKKNLCQFVTHRMDTNSKFNSTRIRITALMDKNGGANLISQILQMRLFCRCSIIQLKLA